MTYLVLYFILKALDRAAFSRWTILFRFNTSFIIYTVADNSIKHGPKTHDRLAFAGIITIAMHSNLESLVYAVSFQGDISIGLSAATDLVLHEFSETVI